MDLRAEGELLIVGAAAQIPKVCVKCGATRGVSRRELPFAVGRAAAGAGMAGGVVGAVVASILRNVLRDEPVLQAVALTALIGGAVAVAWVVSAVTPKIHLQVPLCEEHDARLDAARRNRTLLLAMLGLALASTVIGIGAEWLLAVIAALAVFVAAIAFAFASDMRNAWVGARWAKDERVALIVGADVAKKIVARAERRAAKRAQREQASA